MGLVKAAMLGMDLVASDERLRPSAAVALAKLSERRRKLHWTCTTRTGSAKTSCEEERRLLREIEAVRSRAGEAERVGTECAELLERFAQVVKVLQELDVPGALEAAGEAERRVLVEELVDMVTVFADHLEVTVAGATPLNVLYSEVGLKESETVRAGGGLVRLRHPWPCGTSRSSPIEVVEGLSLSR